MYKSLGQVKLKSGESVEAAVLHGPEPDWADRIIELIGHKGQIWNEQNRCILTQNRGIDTSFYLLLRNKQPFANILITQLNHVAMLSHVYTLPGDRKKGAMAMLMESTPVNFRRGSPVTMSYCHSRAWGVVCDQFGITRNSYCSMKFP